MTTPLLPNLQINTFTYNPAEFSLDHTLASGQCFRWKRQADGWWIGVVGRTVLGIRQDNDTFVWWHTTDPENIRRGDPRGRPATEQTIRDYFQLDIDLGDIVRRISEADQAAGEAARRWSGLRLLRQDTEECILSFVCSTANNVPRIAYSIGEFSKRWGDPIGDAGVRGEGCGVSIGNRGEDNLIGNSPHTPHPSPLHYTFPSAQTLAEVDPSYLSQVTSLGFRGKNLVRVAKQLAERGPGWATSLRDMPYEQAHKELVSIHGIGAKIADCVCLFSLDKTQAVPVDTHVWQIAKTLYFPHWPERKSLTTASYNMVANAFRDRFGDLAGYAQNFLFYDHFSAHWGGVSPLLK